MLRWAAIHQHIPWRARHAGRHRQHLRRTGSARGRRRPGAVAAAPSTASPVEAATLPLNALAAAQALDLLPDGTRSLAITGAGGALGGYATELAVRRGLSVHAVAGAGDEPFLRGLGATFVARAEDPVAAIVEAAGGQVDA